MQKLEEAIEACGETRVATGLRTLPGVGLVLGATIWLEIADVKRLPSAPHLAGNAGLVPTIHASGGKTWRGPTPKVAIIS